VERKYEGGTIDSAALAAGAVAVGVADIAPPGPFEPVGAVFAGTLVLVILGYVGSSRRTVLQSMAMASLIGVMVIPVFGLILETIFWHNNLSLICHDSQATVDTVGSKIYLKNPDGTVASAVGQCWQIGIWAISSAITYFIDRRFQASLG
jgi:hypothetical protein